MLASQQNDTLGPFMAAKKEKCRIRHESRESFMLLAGISRITTGGAIPYAPTQGKTAAGRVI